MDYKFVMRRNLSGRGAIVSSPNFPGESLRVMDCSIVVGLRAVEAVREAMASRRKVTTYDGAWVPPYTIVVGTIRIDREGFVRRHTDISYGDIVIVAGLMNGWPWQNLRPDEQINEFFVSDDEGLACARFDKFVFADFVCEPPANFQ